MGKGTFHGKVAVVTGGAGGIGSAIATEYASCGASVVILDKNIIDAKQAADQIAASTGSTVVAQEVDITNSSMVHDAAQQVLVEFGRVDALVNNAGIADNGATLEATDRDWNSVVNINLSGTFYVSREFGQALIESQGAMVNISSIAGFAAVSPEIHVAYDATKAGVAALSRTLAVEWARHGVRVNAVAPGYTNTELLKNVGAADPEIIKSWISKIPQGRLMEPSDIAKVVVFLTSPDAVAITGQTIVADGGFLAAK